MSSWENTLAMVQFLFVPVSFPPALALPICQKDRGHDEGKVKSEEAYPVVTN